MDEFIDELLHAERMCDIILPRLQVCGRHASSSVHPLCLCVCVCVCSGHGQNKGKLLKSMTFFN